MRNAPLKINSVAGMAVAVFLIIPLGIVCAIMYAIQGPDRDRPVARHPHS